MFSCSLGSKSNHESKGHAKSKVESNALYKKVMTLRGGCLFGVLFPFSPPRFDGRRERDIEKDTPLSSTNHFL